MFSYKKKEPEKSGYIGDMSSQQIECFYQFKQWNLLTEASTNPWHIDDFLLKFCRARKFDLK